MKRWNYGPVCSTFVGKFATRGSIARLLLPLVMLCAAACCSISYAQESTGTISGAVTDPTGAVIPGATVTITSQSTGETKKIEASSSGDYVFVSLVPGLYQIDVEAGGFKHFRRAPIEVQIANTTHLDVPMTLGQASEVVDVTTATPLIETESSSVGQVIEGRTVEETPLNGRNVMNLLALDPGVVPGGSTSGSAQGNQEGGGHTNPSGFGNYQIGGGLPGQSAQFFDGAPLNTLGNSTVAVIPTQDFVQEFKVEINNVSARFGRFSGGVVTMSSKSGGNQLHGTVYEFARNTVFDANDFFSKLNGSPRAQLHQNQYGIAGGGPIKHNKIFYYGSFDRYTYTAGFPYYTNVPTAAERTGDFSALEGTTPIGTNPCDGTAIYQNQIFNPWSSQRVASPAGGTVVCRTAFPGNIVPAQYFDSTANYILNGAQYWPLPTPGTSAATGGAYNFFSDTPIGGHYYQLNGRGDWDINSNNRLFMRYTFWDVHDISQNVLRNITGNPPNHIIAHQAVIGHTGTINPTLILESHLSFTRDFGGTFPVTTGANLAPYGPAWASLQPQLSTSTIPGIEVGPTTDLNAMDDGMMVNQNGSAYDHENSYVFSSNLTKTLSKHTIDAGLDIRLMDDENQAFTFGSGEYNFLGNYTSIDSGLNSTSLYTAPGATTGVKEADLVIGVPSTGALLSGSRTTSYLWYQAYYVTDTYRVKPNLTLNAGLRWELPGEESEARNRMTVLQPNGSDAFLSSKLGTPVTGRLALVDSSEYGSRANMLNHYHLFAPRVGFSYSVQPRTTLHGGYGISFLPSDAGQGAGTSPINAAFTPMVVSFNGGFSPSQTLSSPFPSSGNAVVGPNSLSTASSAQVINEPLGRSYNFQSLYGSTVTSPVPNQPFPYTQQWNLLGEQQIGNSASFSLGYIGSKGTHLLLNSALQLDQLSLANLATYGSQLSTSVSNPIFGYAPYTALAGPTTTLGQTLRPYDQYTSVTNSVPYVGSLSYNALLTKYQQRFGGGGTLLLSYVWSKLISNTDTNLGSLDSGTIGTWQDWDDPRAERSVANINVPQRFVASYVLDLPVGKGKRFLGNASGALDEVVGGWALDGITTLQSGAPLSFTANQAESALPGFGFGVIRPNRVAGCNFHLSGSASQKVLNGSWFNKSCVTQPGAYQLGTESRVDSQISGPGIANYDLALSKLFRITERFNFNFRAEFFNLFNRVQFNNPSTQTDTSTFGTITGQANTPRLVQFAGRINF